MPNNSPHSHRLEQLHLAFVTDGSKPQLLGIACILARLIIDDKTTYFSGPIWILSPDNTCLNFLRGLWDLDFRVLKTELKDDDKYYVQMGLADLFGLLPPNDRVLSLDYDHIVLHPTTLWSRVRSSDILVSSEITRDLGPSINLTVARPCHSDILPQRHLNISLIHGKAKDLHMIGKQWRQAYLDLHPVVAVRNRIEIAFSLAVERAAVIAHPCDPLLQANFALPQLNSCLFHYGGESSGAKYLKEQLSMYSRELFNGEVSLELINTTCDHLAHDLLNVLSTT